MPYICYSCGPNKQFPTPRSYNSHLARCKNAVKSREKTYEAFRSAGKGEKKIGRDSQCGKRQREDEETTSKREKMESQERLDLDETEVHGTEAIRLCDVCYGGTILSGLYIYIHINVPFALTRNSTGVRHK